MYLLKINGYTDLRQIHCMWIYMWQYSFTLHLQLMLNEIIIIDINKMNLEFGKLFHKR